MKHFLAVLVLVALAVAIVAPVAAPPAAYATTGSTTSGFPPIPWAQVWQVVKTIGPILIYLADAILSAVSGGGAPPPPNPPPPPPPPAGVSDDAPCVSGSAGVAWGGGFAAAVACA